MFEREGGAVTADRPVTGGPPATGAHTSGMSATGSGRPSRDFEALFRAEFPTMFRLAHLLGSEDPEDVAQEAFARLHTRWAGLRDHATAGGYLRTTVVNLVRTRHSRAALARHHTPAPPPPDVDSAESDALRRAGNAALIAGLNSIGARHREALVLRFWLDLSLGQIADAMGTSIGTAKSHVSRGLSALRVALADTGGQ